MSPRELTGARPVFSTASGPQHTLRAELRRQERRGEIQVGWQHADLDLHSGRLSVPYVRLKARSVIRRRVMVRWTVFGVSSTMAVAGALYALWTVRIFILSTLGLAALAVLLLRFLPHLSRGCSGIHCSGCRG